MAKPLKPQCKGHPDGLHWLAVEHQRLEPLGHHRHRDDGAALGRDLDPVARHHAHLTGQLFPDLDELLRLDDGIQARVLGPEMEVLGNPVGGCRMRKLGGPAEPGAVVREHACRGLLVTSG